MTENEVIEELKEKLELPFGSNISDEASRMAIKALKEIQHYQAIGTVEECQEAMERQRAKKPIEYEDKYYGCPTCRNPVMNKWEKYPTILNDRSNGLSHCLDCGQNLDWSEDK